VKHRGLCKLTHGMQRTNIESILVISFAGGRDD
ncbi:uncharacterized protein METZ01_LOCUS468853, partial [marine metagenome]